MANISENLQTLNETKQAIKTAIESKGQDLTDIPFIQYAEKINAIESGSLDKVAAEIEITSNITTAQELMNVLSTNIDKATHIICGVLVKPKNNALVNNQIIILFITPFAGGSGIRYRDGIYNIIQPSALYDASATIGDIYMVCDFGEVPYGN